MHCKPGVCCYPSHPARLPGRSLRLWHYPADPNSARLPDREECPQRHPDSSTSRAALLAHPQDRPVARTRSVYEPSLCRHNQIGSWKRAAAGSGEQQRTRDRRDGRARDRTQGEPDIGGDATSGGLACQAALPGPEQAWRLAGQTKSSAFPLHDGRIRNGEVVNEGCVGPPERVIGGAKVLGASLY